MCDLHLIAGDAHVLPASVSPHREPDGFSPSCAEVAEPGTGILPLQRNLQGWRF